MAGSETRMTETRYADLGDPPLPSGTPRTYLGDMGAILVGLAWLLLFGIIVGYTCSTKYGF
jgi:hypothetical protein